MVDDQSITFLIRGVGELHGSASEAALYGPHVGAHYSKAVAGASSRSDHE
jgi:hypothetical protein